jgi:hypothetical protein
MSKIEPEKQLLLGSNPTIRETLLEVLHGRVYQLIGKTWVFLRDPTTRRDQGLRSNLSHQWLE